MDARIRVLSLRLRWAVVAISLAALAYILISFLATNQLVVNAGGHPGFLALWESAPEMRSLLALGQIPSALMAIGLIYWVWRLFGCYAQGDYFGDQSNRCYVWLVWLYGLLMPAGIFASVWVGFLTYRSTDEFTLVIGLDIGKVFTLFVLISVLYILRAAKQIEQENKEFV